MPRRPGKALPTCNARGPAFVALSHRSQALLLLLCRFATARADPPLLVPDCRRRGGKRGRGTRADARRALLLKLGLRRARHLAAPKCGVLGACPRSRLLILMIGIVPFLLQQSLLLCEREAQREAEARVGEDLLHRFAGTQARGSSLVPAVHGRKDNGFQHSPHPSDSNAIAAEHALQAPAILILAAEDQHHKIPSGLHLYQEFQLRGHQFHNALPAARGPVNVAQGGLHPDQDAVHGLLRRLLHPWELSR
mmetsp:Transcript_9346/g.33040  ORF Transcript_9346/g.33040 Transcript_9346/m.33040 type:complete len:251 (+) Transcript_9346:3339-4091(+)